MFVFYMTTPENIRYTIHVLDYGNGEFLRSMVFIKPSESIWLVPGTQIE